MSMRLSGYFDDSEVFGGLWRYTNCWYIGAIEPGSDLLSLLAGPFSEEGFAREWLRKVENYALEIDPKASFYDYDVHLVEHGKFTGKFNTLLNVKVQ